MFKNISRYYWWCQLGGWLFWAVLNIIILNGHQRNPGILLLNQLFLIVIGISVTHLFRTVIVKLNWLQHPLNGKMILLLLAGVALSGAVITLIRGGLNYVFDFDRELNFFRPFLGACFLVLVWVMIYFLWHYFQQEQQYRMDKLRLESVVKGLELRTIKSQLNPHFIFNALNSIRALVDENPRRARTAITELSNILRSSMQAEKAETVSLENELSIVKDYLALEHIRFEERLRVRYEIAPETLDLPMPPMMLQTLVENAIKHGISKSVTGGVVNIRSGINGLLHEIVIQNTGRLNGTMNNKGFGLQSTRQRLELLYKEKASFRIYNKEDNLVEACIQIPL